MTSTYSYGEDSPLKFNIPDKLAQRYNEAVDQYFKAQRRFNQKFGRQWDPVNDPIEIRWSKKHRKAWNQFGKVFDEVIKRDGPFHENDFMDDFLVKNVGSAAAVSDGRWGRVITLAAAGGALYGFFNRR